MRNEPGKRVILNDPYELIGKNAPVQFRLTYTRKLLSTANDGGSKKVKRNEHKHEIREYFHPQLKRLWDIVPFLKSGERSGPSALLLEGDMSGGDAPNYKASYLAKKHNNQGWNFVPLVSQDLDLICGIEILMLRPTNPGGILKSGDIDGRLKTLFDALSMPDNNQGYEQRTQSPEYKPMYVLLEDDRLITKASVETDQLLQFDSKIHDENEVSLVITVSLRPNEMHLGNMQFG